MLSAWSGVVVCIMTCGVFCSHSSISSVFSSNEAFLFVPLIFKIDTKSFSWTDIIRLISKNKIFHNILIGPIKFPKIILFNLKSKKFYFWRESILKFIGYILFPTELHLKNAYYLYSACSNPTDVVVGAKDFAPWSTYSGQLYEQLA